MVVAAAVALSGTFAAAAPANAAMVNNCFSERVCLFENTTYTGSGYTLPSWPCASSLPGFNDKASSVYNNSGVSMKFFQDTNGGGKYIVVKPYSGIADLRSVNIFNADHTVFGWNTLNDRISSACPA
ncbi:peptidase inhibitor family I36 protein [Actinoplanes sp. NPDC051494]|uniref:peptidase inhibitor family I36 protein n=1 Tax=Actinoplanes sp. NPDC051494 TaxID=3363907 RepID=UPI00378DC2D6